MGASCGVIKKGDKPHKLKSAVVLETKHAITSRRIDPTKAKRVTDIDPASALIG